MEKEEQLYQAIEKYNFGKILQLLNDGANQNLVTDDDEFPPIFKILSPDRAHSEMDFKAASILIEHSSFDPNITAYPYYDNIPYTPLKYAYHNYIMNQMENDDEIDREFLFYRNIIYLLENNPLLTKENMEDANKEKERIKKMFGEEAFDVLDDNSFLNNNSFVNNNNNSFVNNNNNSFVGSNLGSDIEGDLNNNFDYDSYDIDYDSYDDEDNEDDNEDDNDDFEIDYERLNFLNDFKRNLHPPYEPFDIFDRNIFVSGNEDDFKIYNYIELENVSLKKYIEEDENNVVFFTLNNNKLYVHTGINKDELYKQIDNDYFFYECDKENQGLRVVDGSFRKDVPYTQIKGDSGNLYVPVIQLAALLDSNHRLWLLDESRILPYTTTLEMIDVGRGRNLKKVRLTEAAVSADHCQKGSEKTLYNLIELHPIGI